MEELPNDPEEMKSYDIELLALAELMQAFDAGRAPGKEHFHGVDRIAKAIHHAYFENDWIGTRARLMEWLGEGADALITELYCFLESYEQNCSSTYTPPLIHHYVERLYEAQAAVGALHAAMCARKQSITLQYPMQSESF